MEHFHFTYSLPVPVHDKKHQHISKTSDYKTIPYTDACSEGKKTMKSTMVPYVTKNTKKTYIIYTNMVKKANTFSNMRTRIQ